MKDKIYLRIAKTTQGYKYKVDKKKNLAPLDNAYTWKRQFFPTLVVALNLEIADTNFRQADAELDLKINDPEMCTDIKIEESEEEDETTKEEV